MAQDSWPNPGHNNRSVTDSEYERLAARFSDDGVYGSPSDPAVVTAGTGLTVRIRADVAASVRGHAWTSGTTGDTLDIAPNTSSAARADRVVLRLDRSDWRVRAVVRQGTPGAAAPPLARDLGTTGLWEASLAQVNVPAGATAVSVTRGELYVGARVRPSLASHLNPHPEPGEMAWTTDTKQMLVWDGSSWRTTYTDSGQVVVDQPVSGWTIQTSSVLQMRDGNVHLRLGSFVRAGGTLVGATDSRLPVLIPSAYRHANRDQYIIVYLTGVRIGRCTLYSQNQTKAGQLWLTQKPDITKGQTILTSGLSWAVG